MATATLIKTGERLIKPLTWVLMIALLWVTTQALAQVTWHLLTPEAETLKKSRQAGFQQRQAASNALWQPTQVAAWTLFGKEQAEQAAPVQQAIDAPKTQLRLVLEGVFPATEAEMAGAIISEQRQGAQYYRVGDGVLGNATLHSVFNDRVILNRGGRLETLPFSDAKDQPLISQAARPVAAAQAGAVSSPEEFVDVAQKRIAENPQAALSSVGLQAVSDSGDSDGYVYNGNNPLLASLNLKKGDVLKSVNGVSLGNIEEDRKLISELYEQGSVEVEIERDGTLFTVFYPFGDGNR